MFQLERRLYRIDGLRLNPAGVPLRGMAYFAVLVGAAALLGALPLVRLVIDVVPWYVRGLLGPAVAATMLTAIRIDGRPVHLAAWSALAFRLGRRSLAAMRPCELLGARWRPGRIVFVVDGSEPRLRELRYTGPGAVRVRAVRLCRETPGPLSRACARRPILTLRLAPENRISRGTAIALRSGARLRVRGNACAREPL